MLGFRIHRWLRLVWVAIALGLAGFPGSPGAIAAGLQKRVAPTSVRVPLTPPKEGYEWVNRFPGIQFSQPVAFRNPPGETNRLFVVERTGRIMVITNLAEPTLTVFLNLRDETLFTAVREQGLLGLAFHPGYATNGFFYVYRTRALSTAAFGLHNEVTRFKVSNTNPDQADPASEVRILAQLDHSPYHNAGDLHFGPDGYLYVSIGYEGPVGDDQAPQAITLDHGLFGGILRLDVDGRPGNLVPNPHPSVTTNYWIPADNPFLGVTNYQGIPVSTSKLRGEYYAVGLRNPWRMSFHPETGALYVADVGQDLWEEVNRIVPGGNYGWPYREGKHNTGGIVFAPPRFESMDPILEMRHGMGTNAANCLISGIFYRGEAIPGLRGRYVFGDFVRGHTWAADLDEGSGGVRSLDWIAGRAEISCFGEDPVNRELLVADVGTGRILILKYHGDGPDGDYPQSVLATGVFEDVALLKPSPGVVPYSLALPFWSDHAIKSRWFTILGESGLMENRAFTNWSFPSGTLWVKHFDMEMVEGDRSSRRRLETRYLVRNEAGAYGLTYRWDPETGDSKLVPYTGLDEVLRIQTGQGLVRTQVWHYPARFECMSCHNPNNDYGLGFTSFQLNRKVDYGDGAEDQLQALHAAGYLANDPGAPESRIALNVPGDESAPVYHRVRSYMEANCAFCHRPDRLNAIWDARLQTRLSDTLLLSAGLSRIVPHSPSDSLVLYRVATRGEFQMPPVGSGQVDESAVSLLQRWIGGFVSSPWDERDLGTPPREGAGYQSNGSIQVAGSGLGHHTLGDEGRFVFVPLSNQVLMAARWVGQSTNATVSARAGIMMRSSDEGGRPRSALVSVDGVGRLWFSWRGEVEGLVSELEGPVVEPGARIRLRYETSRVVAGWSTNGVEWVDFGSVDMAMGSGVLGGLFASSGAVAVHHAAWDDIQILSCNLVSPQVAQEVHVGDDVQLDLIFAATGTAIEKVRFLLDGAVVSEVTATPYRYIWRDVMAGVHSMHAEVFTTNGHGLVSKPFLVQGRLPAVAQFLESDPGIVGGSWQGKVGKLGYAFPGKPVALSQPDSFSVLTGNVAVVSEFTFDPRGLVYPSQVAGRYLGLWGAPSGVTMRWDVEHEGFDQITLYLVDWNRTGSSLSIELVNAETGRLLASRTVGDLGGGKYLSLLVRGSVLIRVSGGNDGLVGCAGLFLDPYGYAPPGVTLTGPEGVSTIQLPYPLTWTATVVPGTRAVSKVEFFVNETKVGERTEVPYALSIDQYEAGENRLKAMVTDDLGVSVESGVLFVSGELPLASAVFRERDDKTQGNWPGRYGGEAHWVVESSEEYGRGIVLSSEEVESVIWDRPGLEAAQALYENVGATNRIASSIYSLSGFDLDLALNDGKAHLVSLYFLDWSGAGWRFNVGVRDVETGVLLDEQLVRDFEGGVYLRWALRGHVRLEFRATVGFAVLSGLFVDSDTAAVPAIRLVQPVVGSSIALPAEAPVSAFATPAPGSEISRVEFYVNGEKVKTLSTPPFEYRHRFARPGVREFVARAVQSNGVVFDSLPVQVTAVSSTASSEALFEGTDTETGGNWVGRYGAEGYALPAYGDSLPRFADVVPQDHSTVLWRFDTEDSRALLTPDSSRRFAGTWFSGSSFSCTIRLTDGRWHRVGLYLLDWDKNAWRMNVEVYSESTGELLDQRDLGQFGMGRYGLWHLRGAVRFQFTQSYGVAAMSGIFFDTLDAVEQWRHDAFPAEHRISDEVSGDEADPDEDGYSNLMEYLFTTNPVEAQRISPLRCRFEGEAFVVEFERSGEMEGIQLGVELSEDLVIWKPWETATGVTMKTLESGLIQYQIRVPLPEGLKATQFVRLRAVHL